MRRVTICITAHEYSALRFLGYAYGRTPSSVTRSALDAYIAANYDDACNRAMDLFSAGGRK
jgi:hypothetical protein